MPSCFSQEVRLRSAHTKIGVSLKVSFFVIILAVLIV